MHGNGNFDARSGEKNVQDWINVVCAALLFISPWALGILW